LVGATTRRQNPAHVPFLGYNCTTNELRWLLWSLVLEVRSCWKADKLSEVHELETLARENRVGGKGGQCGAVVSGRVLHASYKSRLGVVLSAGSFTPNAPQRTLLQRFDL